MSTFDVLRAATTPPRKPAVQPEPAVRREPRVDHASTEQRAERARFAKVLAFLASTGESTRAELLDQMPPGDANLLDKLLADAGGADAGTQTDAASSLHYEMLTQSRIGVDVGNGADGLRGVHGLSGASRNGNIETLARLAERRGASLEELLALGDSKGADLRNALDALLARAGTPEGVLLAGSPGMDDAALVAHAAALADARAKSAADVATPVRDTAALAPEFRSRMERVIDRMKSEYGHNVEVVETARSQERQDHLFEQGRTRGGPVVTWTRDSAHLTGHAADVLVDGKWNNAEGYARLQRIAREEGLRTLGMRDPGHLELPKDARTSRGADVLAQLSSRKAQSTVNASMPAANGVAAVASVASVASVAPVAQQGAVAPQAPSPFNQALSNQASADTSAGSSGNERRESDASDSRRAPDDASSLGALGMRGMQPSVGNGTAPGERVAPPAGAEAFDRVMEAQRVRDNAPARPLSQLTLQVDAPNGGKDEITIGMRGNSVNTQILTDAQNAERLRMRTGELQDALGRHGLDADTVRISGNGRLEGADVNKAVANSMERDALKVGVAQQSQQGDGGTTQQQRDRASNARDWQERQETRREREEQRQSESERQRRNPFNPESK